MKTMKRDSRNYELIIEQGTELIEFYRENPCIAAYELLGVDLAPIQRVIFQDMWFKNYVIVIAGRGVGKTFLLGTLSALSCMLYPGYRVGLIAPVFRQSKMIFSEYLLGDATTKRQMKMKLMFSGFLPPFLSVLRLRFFQQNLWWRLC